MAHKIVPYVCVYLIMLMAVYSLGEATNRPISLDVDLFKISSHKLLISCTFDPSLSSMETVDQLHIYGSRPDSRKGDLKMLASVGRLNSKPTLFGGLNSDVVDISGSFGLDSNKSELHLSWISSQQGSRYRYKCVAQGTDQAGQLMTTSEFAEITSADIDPFCSISSVGQLLKALDDLENGTAAANTRLSDAEESMKDVENTSNTDFEMTITKHLKPVQEKIIENNQNLVAVKNSLAELKDSIGKINQILLSTQKKSDAAVEFDISGMFKGKHYIVSKAEWSDIVSAETSCEQYGGYLVEIDDQEEFDFVLNFVKSIGGAKECYTGMNDIGQEGRYVFYYSQKPASFFKWAHGEPNNVHNEDCSALSPRYNGMNDLPCQPPYDTKYICEVQF